MRTFENQAGWVCAIIALMVISGLGLYANNNPQPYTDPNSVAYRLIHNSCFGVDDTYCVLAYTEVPHGIPDPCMPGKTLVWQKIGGNPVTVIQVWRGQ